MDGLWPVPAGSRLPAPRPRRDPLGIAGHRAGPGPGTAVLGDIAGKRLLDVGSGGGRHAAHLARDRHAQVDAIDISPTQHERALARYGPVEGVRFLLGDAIEHLRQAEPYDVMYSVHGLGFIDPHRSLPALRARLRPGGRLVCSVLHTDLHSHGPSSGVESRPQQIRLKGMRPLDVHMWVLAPRLWEDLLADYGFTVEGIDLLARPDGDPVVDQLVRARRRDAPVGPSVSRPRSE